MSGPHVPTIFLAVNLTGLEPTQVNREVNESFIRQGSCLIVDYAKQGFEFLTPTPRPAVTLSQSSGEVHPRALQWRRLVSGNFDTRVIVPGRARRGRAGLRFGFEMGSLPGFLLRGANRLVTEQGSQTVASLVQ
jgi:hypothetical protein